MGFRDWFLGPSTPTIRPWTDPVPGELPIPRGCDAVDRDAQPCTAKAGHIGSHRRNGIRAWLEMGNRSAVIRIYMGNDPDPLEDAEAAMFRRYGFVPIARHEVEQTTSGGLDPTGVLLLGILAPSKQVTFRTRIVCFAVPG